MSIGSLTAATQESLVALLCFDDHPRGAKFVRALVQPKIFDIYWREIAQAAADYLDAYGKPPGEHTQDLIEALCARDEKKAPTYLKLYESIKETKDRIHREYVLDQALAFARWQRLNAGINAALSGLEKDSKEGVEEAEAAIAKALKNTSDIFDPGTMLTDERAMSFLEMDDETWPLGIPALDKHNLGPGVGRLHLFAGPLKSGKTWWCLYLAKRSVMFGKTVVYITLEISERLALKRAFQTFFALSDKQAKTRFKRVRFASNEFGSFADFEQIEIAARPSLQDENIGSTLRKFQGRLKNRPRFIVKQFPTGELTLRGLEGYLDGLEAQGIIPDHVIIDYADLMTQDHKNLRGSLGATYVGLRGIAVRRRIAVSTPTQINREGAKAKRGDVTHMSEDWSKGMIADTVLIYSRTDQEKELGMARILVGAAREGEDRFTVLISQNYALGQFCLDSTRMGGASYWEKVKEAVGAPDTDTE